MENIVMEKKDGRYILNIDESITSDNVIQDFVNRLRFDELSKKADYDNQQLSIVSEEIKEKWWNSNKESILQKIKGYQP